MNVDTPVAAAICRSVCPPASSPAIRAASPGVSFDAPLGPRRAGTSPATPPEVSAWSHRQTVAGSTPNASATWPCDAARNRTSCTAASRAARLVPGIPGEGGQPVHRNQPAVLASQQAHAGGDLGRPGRQQRERKLAEHTSHHPPSRQVVYLARIFSQTGHAGTERHAVNADQPASITQAVGSMSGVLEHYSVSKATVTRTLRILADEGLVRGRAAVGDIPRVKDAPRQP